MTGGVPMKRAVWLAFVAALAVTAFSALPAAAESGWIAAGLGVVSGKPSHGWVYGEVQLQDDFALAAEYVSPGVSVFGRFGGEKGPYAQGGRGGGQRSCWGRGPGGRARSRNSVSAGGRDG